MKFKIKIADSNSPEGWYESYDFDITDPQEWAENTVKYFNDTLRPKQLPRTLLEVVVEDESSDNLHDWVKMAYGMSVNFRGSTVDLYRCSKCGITGKRYGISSNIIIDSKYRKKVYQRCDTAKIAMSEEE